MNAFLAHILSEDRGLSASAGTLLDVTGGHKEFLLCFLKILSRAHLTSSFERVSYETGWKNKQESHALGDTITVFTFSFTNNSVFPNADWSGLQWALTMDSLTDHPC